MASTQTPRHDRIERHRTSGQGRPASTSPNYVLILVPLFTIAFIAVVAIKLSQEWHSGITEAEVNQAITAARLSERAAARIALAQGAAAGAASGLQVDWRGNAKLDVFSHLNMLTERPDIAIAALVSPDGRVRATTNAAAGAALARAEKARGDRTAWTALDSNGQLALFVAADLYIENMRRTIVAQLHPGAIAPPTIADQQLALVGMDNRIIASKGQNAPQPGQPVMAAFGVPDAAAANISAVASDLGRGARIKRPNGDYGLGVARVSSSGVDLYVFSPLRINIPQWRRTLLFYLLLMVAPILVAAGLSTVLLMQMASIRRQREQIEEKELRFRLAIEGARCGVWDWNLSDDTVFITDSLASMLGRKVFGEMRSADFLDLIRPEDREKLRTAIRSATNSREIDVEFRAKDLPVWLHARGRPWPGVGDQGAGRMVGVAIDITEQKGAQARVAAAETRLRAALESMSESFVLLDSQRRLVLSNPKYREFFSIDEKLDRPGTRYDMLEMAAQAAILAEHSISEDGTREYELADERWLHVSERRTADGGVVSIGTDITALKRTEAQLIEGEKKLRAMVTDLQRAKEQSAEFARRVEEEKIRAEEANRSKSEFLANMSHELRTPLNAINGFSEMMQGEMFGPLGDARYRDYVNDILASGQHLLELINDILDMSKIEAGKFRLAPETITTDEILDQCLRIMRGRAREAGLELIIDAGEGQEIFADPRAIKQVLLNLMSNAVKFTPEGGKVAAEARRTGSTIEFSVTDTGIGIARDDIPRLGQPFEQIASQHSKAHKGSGLGLALSKSLVELHGGALQIESTLGEGTRVSFTIPVNGAPEKIVESAVNATRSDQSVSAEKPATARTIA